MAPLETCWKLATRILPLASLLLGNPFRNTKGWRNRGIHMFVAAPLLGNLFTHAKGWRLFAALKSATKWWRRHLTIATKGWRGLDSTNYQEMAGTFATKGWRSVDDI